MLFGSSLVFGVSVFVFCKYNFIVGRRRIFFMAFMALKM